MKDGFMPMMSKKQAEAIAKRKDKMNMSIVDHEDTYYYPETIRFTAEQLPAIKDWKVGEEYEISLKVVMKSYEERNSEIDGKTKEKKEARFEIVAVKSEKEEGEEDDKPKYGYVKTS